MKHSAFILSTAVFLLGNAADAQQGRADRALNNVPGADTRINQGTVNDVVTPYETNSPPESGYDHTTFEDRIYDMRQEDNDQGRVLRATEDSAAIRPDVDIDAQGQLFDDANWAHENADDIAGHYFTSENGQCTQPSVPVSQVMDRFCESLPARETRTCELIRRIWVDRSDYYRCDKRAAQYVKVCNKDIAYSCQVNSSNRNCIRGNISISGASSRWSGNRLIVDVSHAGNGGGGNKTARLNKRSFTMRVSDHTMLTEATLRRVRGNGVVQVILNGTVVGTWGGRAVNGFGGGGSNCARNDRDGLLTGMTHYQTGYCHRRYRDRNVFAYLDKSSSPPDTRHLQQYRHRRIDHGNSDAAIRNYCDPINRNFCPVFSNVNQNRNTSLNVLRFMNLRQRGSVNPEVGKQYQNNMFQVRVVYESDRRHAGWASLEFEFSGSCCDSFPAVEDETCL